MNQAIGSKNGKNNRRIFNLNKKRKEKIEILEKEETKKKEEEIQKEKIIIISTNEEKQSINIEPIKNEINNSIKDKPSKIKEIKKIKPKEKQETTSKANKLPPIPKPIKPNQKQQEKEIRKDNQTIEPIQQTNEIKTSEPTEIINDKDYLEKQIIKILEENIEENRFKLKKLDSEIHTIEKEIDNLNTDEDIEDLEKEIEELIKKLNKIKTQIESLQKTFEYNFPVKDPDNYLIYLVDEFKIKRKNENELSDKLKDKKEFKSIIDKIMEIEEKQEELLQKTEERKNKLDLDNQKVEKMNNNIIDIEDMKKRIENMLNQQNKLLEDVKEKVNETVHITEKVDYITKSVKHSLFELFMLMGILKHNLSIKNNVIAAISAKIALDAILKMTTPIEEKVITKVSDVKDYEKLIDSCLNDSGKLKNIIDENLTDIESIRYKFENEYKECSYLPSYQEVIKNLNILEIDIKERKKDVIKMEQEIQIQLEKNNAKIKKYGSI